MFDIPKVKPWPAGAVQCSRCGGTGCELCRQRGWFEQGDPRGRKCERQDCNNPIPPDQVAVYCSNECALEDA